jgi:hypothetical protein
MLCPLMLLLLLLLVVLLLLLLLLMMLLLLLLPSPTMTTHMPPGIVHLLQLPGCSQRSEGLLLQDKRMRYHIQARRQHIKFASAAAAAAAATALTILLAAHPEISILMVIQTLHH